VLLDSILQDKPVTLQMHLMLHIYRTMSPTSRHFHLSLQDLRYASDFYGRVYDRRHGGRAENNYRSPLMRHSTVSGALHSLDSSLDKLRHRDEAFKEALQHYACGETVPGTSSKEIAWYLLRHGTPASSLLMTLRDLANEAHSQCVGFTAEKDMTILEEGMKAVVHATGTRMTAALGVGWSSQSLEDIVACWRGVL
jgi:anaphase-promoting complex subunit 1